MSGFWPSAKPVCTIDSRDSQVSQTWPTCLPSSCRLVQACTQRRGRSICLSGGHLVVLVMPSFLHSEPDSIWGMVQAASAVSQLHSSGTWLFIYFLIFLTFLFFIFFYFSILSQKCKRKSAMIHSTNF